MIQARPAYACSCAPPGSPQDALNDATAVFGGTVTAIEAPFGTPICKETFPFIDVVVSSGDPVRVIFEVTDVWKGAVDRRVIVTTSRNGASCGYSFQVGERYLVYASSQSTELRASLCSRTNHLAQAQNDLVVLGAGAQPAPSAAIDTATGLSLPVKNISTPK
jgi:hypothetical protein